MKRILAFAIVMGLMHPVAIMAEQNPFQKKVNEFISIALENNPELLEAKSRIQSFREIPSQAGSIDDPMLKFELMNIPIDSFDLGQEPMTQKQITLSQNLPYPGKLNLRSEMANKNVSIAEENLEDLKLKVIKQMKQSYFELSFVLEATKITEQNKSLLEQFVKIAETKYSVGKGFQQDVLKAQVELSKILDELIQLTKRRESEQARLNTLMNLLPQEPISIPQGMTKTEFKYSIEELQKLAVENRPALKQITRLKERFQVARQLAEKEYYPDFNVGFKYGQREDGPMIERSDFISAFVGINIPLWFENKQSRKVAEEGFKIDEVQQAYNNVRNQVFLKIKELMEEEKQGADTLSLIGKGIIPQARQSLESALGGYPVDKVDFLTLLDNQVTLFKWEIKYHKELTDYEKNLAELEHVVGKQLFFN